MCLVCVSATSPNVALQVLAPPGAVHRASTSILSVAITHAAKRSTHAQPGFTCQCFLLAAFCLLHAQPCPRPHGRCCRSSGSCQRLLTPDAIVMAWWRWWRRSWRMGTAASCSAAVCGGLGLHLCEDLSVCMHVRMCACLCAGAH